MRIILYRESDGEICHVQVVNRNHDLNAVPTEISEIAPQWRALGLREILIDDDVRPESHRVEIEPRAIRIVEKNDPSNPWRPGFRQMALSAHRQRTEPGAQANLHSMTNCDSLAVQLRLCKTRWILGRDKTFSAPEICTEVSVMIPCWNAARYLADALDSLCAQTMKRWEAIIVCQGGEDDSAAIARSYAGRDERFRVYEIPLNLGQAFARNYGIHFAGGRYCAFLDADDAYLPDALEKLLGGFRDYESPDVVHGDKINCDENLSPTPEKGRQLAGAITFHRLLNECVTIPGVLMAHRDVFWESGGWFNEAYLWVEDYEWQLYCYPMCRFKFVPAAVLYRRRHESNSAAIKGPHQRAWSHFTRNIYTRRFRGICPRPETASNVPAVPGPGENNTS